MFSLKELGQAINDKIEETLTGFKKSNQSPDYFGRTQDTIAHKGFVVQLPSSSASADRQRRSIGELLDTIVRVIFAYRLRPLDLQLDYLESLDTEKEVINNVLGAYNKKFTLRYNGSSRVVTESQEYIIITLEFVANHTI